MRADAHLHVTDVPPAAQAMAMKVALRSCPQDLAVPQIAQALTRQAQDPSHLRHLLAVYDQQRPIAAIWAQSLPGKIGMLWGPDADHPAVRAELSTRLLECLLTRLEREGTMTLIQALSEQDEARESLLRQHGFLAPVVMRYLVSSDLPSEPQAEALEVAGSPLEFETYHEAHRARWEAVIGRTYLETQDIPQLNGVRRLTDVLDGYQQTGSFRPELWSLARRADQDVGCLLLTDHPSSDYLELVYMGTVPEARGQRIGQRIVQRALAAGPSVRSRAADPGRRRHERTRTPALRTLRYGSAGPNGVS